MKIEMTQLIPIANSNFKVALLAPRAAFRYPEIIFGNCYCKRFERWFQAADHLVTPCEKLHSTTLDPRPSAAIRGHPSRFVSLRKTAKADHTFSDRFKSQCRESFRRPKTERGRLGHSNSRTAQRIRIVNASFSVFRLAAAETAALQQPNCSTRSNS